MSRTGHWSVRDKNNAEFEEAFEMLFVSARVQEQRRNTRRAQAAGLLARCSDERAITLRRLVGRVLMISRAVSV